jgi:hypothetical protein
MNLIRILFVLFLTYTNCYSQSFEQHYVTAKKLNVRDQPIIDDGNVIYQFKKGEIVNVKNIKENWAEIELDNNTIGFVSVKYISKSSDSVISNTNTKSKSKWLYWILGIGSVIIGFIIIMKRYNNKCDECGKWGSLKIIKTETVEKIPSTIIKTLNERVKNSKGETIRTKTKEIAVPATKYKYKVYRQCVNCNQVYTHLESETKEN